MRVIGGEARGRKFNAPRSPLVRPTADRVREAMFDIVASLGGLLDRTVLDLFAGSGALGIESLSRGASFVTFVERETSVGRSIEESLRSVRLFDTGRFSLVYSDAIAFCRNLADRPRPWSGNRHFDVTFCDPPYRFSSWEKLLASVPGDLVVFESDGVIALPERLQLYRSYRYGSTLLTVASPSKAGESAPHFAQRKDRT